MPSRLAFGPSRSMAPLPQVHAERGDAAQRGEDPVLEALQRYRAAAGSTFHPLSEAGHIYSTI